MTFQFPKLRFTRNSLVAWLAFDCLAPSLVLRDSQLGWGLVSTGTIAILLAQLANLANRPARRVESPDLNVGAQLVTIACTLMLGMHWHDVSNFPLGLDLFAVILNCLAVVYGAVAWAVRQTQSYSAAHGCRATGVAFVVGLLLIDVGLIGNRLTGSSSGLSAHDQLALGMLVVAVVIGISTAINVLVLADLVGSLKAVANHNWRGHAQNLTALLTTSALESAILYSLSVGPDARRAAITVTTFLAAKAMFVALVLRADMGRMGHIGRIGHLSHIPCDR